jgi:hypothetical protein
MRHISRLRRFVDLVTPAHLCGQSLSIPGSPAPYGDVGELRALPWEGLQLQEAGSVAGPGR